MPVLPEPTLDFQPRRYRLRYRQTGEYVGLLDDHHLANPPFTGDKTKASYYETDPHDEEITVEFLHNFLVCDEMSWLSAYKPAEFELVCFDANDNMVPG
jgi:hypothetical protein